MPKSAIPSRAVYTMKDLEYKKTRRKTGWVTRFWLNVKRCGLQDCWPWIGYKLHGYGVLNIDGRPVGAHRLSFLLHNELIDPELMVIHSCDNPACVNPIHLRQGTQADNMRDAAVRGRIRRGSDKWKAILKEPDVIDIRRQRNNGVPSRVLEMKYGVTQPCISAIVHGVNWKHLPLHP